MSPTQRSLKRARDAGYEAGVVERWNPHSRTRHDLFGVIDLVELREDRIVGVQVTSSSNISARVAKAKAEPRLAAWLRCGGLFEVHGWGKRQHNNRKLWRVRVVELHPEDLQCD